jgi:hypothetical protein
MDTWPGKRSASVNGCPFARKSRSRGSAPWRTKTDIGRRNERAAATSRRARPGSAHHASSFALRDDAKIGEAAINSFVVRGTRLLITCDVPVVIELEVSRLEVELLVYDTVVDSVRRTRVSVSQIWQASDADR